MQSEGAKRATPVVEASGYPAIAGFDALEAESRLGLDWREVAELLLGLLESTDPVQISSEMLVEVEGRQSLRKQLHRVKGAAANLAATTLALHAEEMERLLSQPSQAGELDVLTVRAAALNEELWQLRADLAQVRQLAASHSATPALPPSQGNAKRELLVALHERRVEAVDLLNEVTHADFPQLSEEGYGEFREAVQALRFRKAGELLTLSAEDERPERPQ